MSKQAKAKKSRKCGHCALWSMWTGTCCNGGDFKERSFDDKACGDWEDDGEDYDPSIDSASYDPEDDNY